MKTKQKHTPTPWKIEYNYLSDDCFSVVSEETGEIVYFKGFAEDRAPSIENTEFILRAVKQMASHEELLDLVKSALAYVKQNDIGDTNDFQDMMEKAIAKAEGQP